MRNKYSVGYCIGLMGLVIGNTGAFAQTDQQINRLQELARESRAEWQIRHTEALEWAERTGEPVRRELSDGTVIVLQKMDELGHPVYHITHNLDAAETSSVDALWPGGSAGLDLTGTGRTISMWETGVPLKSHNELEDRITHANEDASVTQHATHVAGTMIASGVDPDAQGMAREATVEAYDTESNVSEQQEAAAGGMLAANHSWGTITGWNYNSDEGAWYWHGNINVSETEDYRFGFYNSQAKKWDETMHNAPDFMIVKAAGNDRNDAPEEQPTDHYVYDPGEEDWVLIEEEDGVNRDPDGGDDGYMSLGLRATAKNILTVGAVKSDSEMTEFSGWGPTNDGRIKPDIVAQGYEVYSSGAMFNNHYFSTNGTSMATPVVTGTVTLLQEHYNNLHGENPRASTIKSLIIHTADEVDAEGPDYRNGWGLLNAERAAEVISEDFDRSALDHIQELTLSNGQTYEHQVWSDGEEPIRATIAWTDPPGEPVSASLDADDRMLVNDLDLRLIDDDGNEYEPYILNPSNPSATAITGDNDRDNVEQVFIEAPDPGHYTVEVTHKESLEGGWQNFSLVITGNNNDCTLTVASDESIQDAVNEAGPGDIVCIMPGTYDEDVQILNTENITLVADDPEDRPILNGAAAGQSNGINIDHASGTVIDGVIVDDFSTGIAIRNSTGVTIQNATAQHNGSGFRITEESHNSRISGSEAIGNTIAGIHVAESFVAEITGNLVEDTERWAIHLFDEADGATIEDNDIIDNGSPSTSVNYSGIRVRNSENVTISGNNILNTVNIGVKLTDTESVTIEDNTIENNSRSGVYLEDAIATSVTGNQMAGHNNVDMELQDAWHSSFQNNSMTNGIHPRINRQTESEDFSYAMSGNTINDRPVHYSQGVDNPDIPDDAGQVIIAKSQNVTITGLDFENQHLPVQVFFSGNVTVSDNTADQSSQTSSLWGDFSVWHSSGVTLTGNTFTAIESHQGIMVAESDDINISDNTFTGGNRRAVRLYHVTQTTVEKNTLEGNGSGSLLVEASENNVMIRENDIINNRGSGIALGQSTVQFRPANKEVTIYGNTVTGNEGVGISLRRSEHTVIENNTIVNNDFDGIRLTGDTGPTDTVDHTEIRDNTIENSGSHGVNIFRGDHVTVKDNIISGNGDNGISAGSSDFLTVSGNTIGDNPDYGIESTFSENVSISQNEIYQSDSGVWLRAVNGFSATGNEFSDLDEYGISVGTGETYGNEITGVIIQDNTFTECKISGIILWQAALNAEIANNTVYGSEHGIIDHGTGSMISGNHVHDNRISGIYFDDAGGALASNNDLNENETGFLLTDSENITLQDNALENNLIYGMRLAAGLTDVTVTSNDFQGQDVDLLLDHAHAVTLNENIFERGVLMEGDDPVHYDHTLSDNTVHGLDIYHNYGDQNVTIPSNPGQVIIAGVDNYEVSGLTIDSVAVPVQVAFGKDITVTDLTITNASWDAIRLTHVTKSEASGNTIQFPGETGDTDETERSEEPEQTEKNKLSEEPEHIEGTGIRLLESTDVDVFENSVDNAIQHGLYLINTQSSNLADNQITKSRVDGIHVAYSEDIVVSENAVSENGRSGVYLTESSASSIRDNTFSHQTGHGVYLADAAGNDVTSNEISHNETHGIHLSRSVNIVIDDNSITDQTLHGIHSENHDSLAISGNRIEANNKSGAFLEESSSGLFITGNLFQSNSEDGLVVDDGELLHIHENEFSGNQSHGLYIRRAQDILVEDNLISKNSQDGAHLSGNANNDSLRVLNNTLEHNQNRGIYWEQHSFLDNTGTVIRGNTVSENRYGIELSVAEDQFMPTGKIENLLVIGNMIEDNQNTGILVSEEPDGEDNLVITENIIQGNGVGVDYDAASGFGGADSDLDARNNWWGAADGPGGSVRDPETNTFASGGGDDVTSQIRFDPWLEEVPIEGVYFEITGISTNSPVEIGEELQVEASLENIGDETGTQKIFLENFEDEAVDSIEVTLDGGDTQKTTLVWDTGSEDAGEGIVTVQSHNESASVSAVIIDPDEFFNITECREVEQEGTYHITDDISSSGKNACISISTSDVTLYGNDHTISGEGSGIGLEIVGFESDVDNVKVRDLTITGWNFGIGIAQSNENTLENITVEGNNEGLVIMNAGKNTISDFVTRDNDENGIMVDWNAGENTFENFVADSNGVHGISLHNSHKNTFLDGDVRYNNEKGVFVSGNGESGDPSTGNHFEGLNVTENRRSGLYIAVSEENEFRDIVLDGNESHGIHLNYMSRNNLFHDISVQISDSSGIYLSDQNHYNTFEQVAVSGAGDESNGYAIQVDTVNYHNQWSDVTISSTGNGMSLHTDSTKIDSLYIHNIEGVAIQLGSGASENMLSNLVLYDNETDFITCNGAENNPVDSMSLGETLISFNARDVIITEADPPAQWPEDHTYLERYVKITELSGEAEDPLVTSLRFHYNSETVADMNEESLEIWRYRNQTWSTPEEAAYTSGVNTEEQFVYAEDITGFSIFAVVNSEIPTPADLADIPEEFRLDQNYPNPFNPQTTIRYALPEAANVRLDVYNILGKRVLTLVDARQDAGIHEVSFDGDRFSSGVYLYHIRAGEFLESRQMLLVK